MANPTAPTVAIELDKTRHLKFTFNAMIQFEKRTGKKIQQIGKEPSMEDLLVLVWACLRHEDKDLTIEDVGDMLHLGNLGEVQSALAQLIKDSSRSKDGSEGDDPTKSPIG